MNRALLAILLATFALGASADGNWRTTLAKVKNLTGDTGISGFIKKEAPAYITGNFAPEDRPPAPALAPVRQLREKHVNRRVADEERLVPRRVFGRFDLAGDPHGLHKKRRIVWFAAACAEDYDPGHGPLAGNKSRPAGAERVLVQDGLPEVRVEVKPGLDVLGEIVRKKEHCEISRRNNDARRGRERFWLLGAVIGGHHAHAGELRLEVAWAIVRIGECGRSHDDRQQYCAEFHQD